MEKKRVKLQKKGCTKIVKHRKCVRMPLNLSLCVKKREKVLVLGKDEKMQVDEKRSSLEQDLVLVIEKSRVE
jgi:hypothetical protein